MTLIKQKYYEIFVYPKFIKNIKKVLNENNILIRVKFEDSKAIIYYILQDKLFKIEKDCDNALIETETQLDNIKSFIGKNNLADFIQDLKLNAEIITGQNFIDFIFNTFKEAVSYYKLSRIEYQRIYEIVLNDKAFFRFNAPATVIHNEGVKNKWID